MGSVDVEYTVYKQDDDTKHYYFTAVDWYNDSDNSRCVQMEFDGKAYDVSMNFGELVKVVTNGKAAVYPECDCCEILEILKDCFMVQGYGKQNFYVLGNGVAETVEVDFENNPVRRVEL